MKQLYFIKDIKKAGTSCPMYEGTKKYVATADIIYNQICGYENVEYNTKPSRANFCVKQGDVIFAKMQNSIKVIKIDSMNESNIYSTGFYGFSDDRLNSNYLRLYFLSPQFNTLKDSLCHGATMKAINDEGMACISIPYYSIEKQNEIVEELDIIEELISKRKKQLEELDLLIKSRFKEMFGTIDKPKELFYKDKLINLCNKITDGKHGGCKIMLGTGKYFIGAKEIFNDKVNYENAPQIKMEDFIKDYKRCNLEIGDLLIVNTGATIGKTAIAVDVRSKDTLLQKSVAMLKPKSDILNVVFLKYCYKFNKSMCLVTSASAQPNLLLSKIKNTMIYVPNICMQNKFADFVNEVDRMKEKIKASIEELETLKNKQMQKYFG